MPAAAKADGSAAAEVKGVPLRIVDSKLALQTQRAVVSYA
jgi:hypothetical protein